MTNKAAAKVLLYKIESVYGTDPVPDATKAIRALNLTFNPYQASALARGPAMVKPTIGNSLEPQALLHNSIGFDVQIVGGGAAGTAPYYDEPLRSCGIASTVSVGVDVQYDPVSSAEESGTFYYNWTGDLHKSNGVRGSAGVVIEHGEVPRLRFSNFTGLYNDPADAALPVIDWSTFQKPREASKINTPVFTIDGYAAKLRRFELQQNNVISYRDLTNMNDVVLGGRNPRGSVTFEKPPLGTKNFFTIAKQQAAGAVARSVVQAVHGVGAGKIFQVDAPAVQIGNPRYEEIEGVVYLTLDLKFDETDAGGGDDEFKLTVK